MNGPVAAGGAARSCDLREDAPAIGRGRRHALGQSLAHARDGGVDPVDETLHAPEEAVVIGAPA